MNIILGLFLCLSLGFNSFDWTLIFKDNFVTKGSLEYAGEFECSKYNQIKISINSKNNKYPKTIKIAGYEEGVAYDINLDTQNNPTSDYVKMIKMPPQRVSIYLDGAEGNRYAINVWGIK